MATQIGPLTARIIANSEGLEKGLKQAEQKVTAAGKTFGAGFASGFANAMQDGLRGAFDLARLGVVWGTGGLLAGAAAATATLVTLYKEGASSVRDMAAGAKEANVGLRDFQIVATAIGDIGVASNALGEMREKLFEIQVQGGAASGVLASIIPDAFELEAMGTAKAFGVISDRIRQLGSRSAQITAVKGVFKKAGEPAMEAILRGSGYLGTIGRRLEDFGAGMDEQTYASLKAADMAWKQIGIVRKGAANQVTIAFAPGIAELLANLPKLADLGITAKGLAGVIVEGAGKLLEGAGRLADTFAAWIDDPWGMLRQTWEDLWNWAKGLWDSMLAQLGALFDSLVANIGAAIEAAIKAATDFAARIKGWIDEGKQPIPAGAGKFPRFGGGGAPSAAEELSDLEAGGGAFGTWDDAAAGGWRKRGRFEEMAAKFMQGWKQRMVDIVKFAEENNPFYIWQRAAETFAEKLDTPFDKFKAEWLKLQGILRVPRGGFPAEGGLEALLLHQKIQGRGGWQLLQQLRGLGGQAPGTTFVGAAEEGSREAYSAIAQYTSARESLEQEIKRLAEQALEIQKRQEADGRDAVRILRQMKQLFEPRAF